MRALKLDGGKVYNTIYDCLPGAKAGTTTALVSSVQNGSNKLSYTYDKLGNIQTISENGTLKCTYHYDELNRLVREDNVWENKTIAYSYDLGGNMTSWKEYAYTNPANAVPATAAKQNTYTYGNTTWKDQLTAYNGQTITYDGMGNPLSYRGMTMTWEKGRQLKQVVKGGKTNSYAYDNSGVRISKTADGVKTSYYLSGDRIIGLKKGSEVIQFAYDEKGTPVSMLAGGKRYYYLYNAQGDVIGLLDSAGTQVVTYRYNSWGKLLSVSDSTTEKIGSKNPFRYRGYCLDEETGLYYVTSRYYDPEIGRFVNADNSDVLTSEYQNFDQYNLYVHCFNNPVNMQDDEGAWPKWVSAAIGVTVITGLAVATAMTGGTAAIICGAALTGSLIGSGIGAGIGLATGGVEDAFTGFAAGAMIGGTVGAGLAGINIASGGVQIVGSAQKTGTAFHQTASNIQAGKMAMQPGRYSKITFDKALKTAGLNGRKRPDVIGVARYGKNKIVEVVSKSQTQLQMKKKCASMELNNPGTSSKVVSWPGRFANFRKRLLK